MLGFQDSHLRFNIKNQWTLRWWTLTGKTQKMTCLQIALVLRTMNTWNGLQNLVLFHILDRFLLSHHMLVHHLPPKLGWKMMIQAETCVVYSCVTKHSPLIGESSITQAFEINMDGRIHYVNEEVIDAYTLLHNCVWNTTWLSRIKSQK